MENRAILHEVRIRRYFLKSLNESGQGVVGFLHQFLYLGTGTGVIVQNVHKITTIP